MCSFLPTVGLGGMGHPILVESSIEIGRRWVAIRAAM